MEQKYTDRQVWDVLRSLVSENNNSIKRIYSSAVAARINTLSDRNPKWTKAFANEKKLELISTGLKEIYKEIADRILRKDDDSKNYYLVLLEKNQNWYDKLSSVDLFKLFVFQNKTLNKFSNIEKLNMEKAVTAVKNIKFGKYFEGKVEFSGRPKETGKPERIDVKNKDIRQEVLILSSQKAFDRYRKNLCLNSRPLKENEMTHIYFGNYRTAVLKRYFKEKENTSKELSQESIKKESFKKENEEFSDIKNKKELDSFHNKKQNKASNSEKQNFKNLNKQFTLEEVIHKNKTLQETNQGPKEIKDLDKLLYHADNILGYETARFEKPDNSAEKEDLEAINKGNENHNQKSEPDLYELAEQIENELSYETARWKPEKEKISFKNEQEFIVE